MTHPDPNQDSPQNDEAQEDEAQEDTLQSEAFQSDEEAMEIAKEKRESDIGASESLHHSGFLYRNTFPPTDPPDPDLEEDEIQNKDDDEQGDDDDGDPPEEMDLDDIPFQSIDYPVQGATPAEAGAEGSADTEVPDKEESAATSGSDEEAEGQGQGEGEGDEDDGDEEDDDGEG